MESVHCLLSASGITSHSPIAIDAEYLHFFAVNIMLCPRIDRFDFRKVILPIIAWPRGLSVGGLRHSARDFYHFECAKCIIPALEQQ
jgi:hypothetical protein